MSGTAGPVWRTRVRRTRGGRFALKVAVFLLGAAFIVLGLVLVILPGPLTIPPILLGVYLWSTEFAWAERLRDRAMEAGRTAWEAARNRPVHTAAVTLLGLALAGVALYTAGRMDVLARVRDVLG